MKNLGKLRAVAAFSLTLLIISQSYRNYGKKVLRIRLLASRKQQDIMTGHMEMGKRIGRLVHLACVLEACAPKPGNVNRYHDFSDTTLEDFLLSAAALSPVFENADRMQTGQIIWQATLETRRCVHLNTNLGIILLLAPLARAVLAGSESSAVSIPKDTGYVRENLRSVLKSLTIDDARLAFAAIRLAQPGGLGRAGKADVAEEPSVTLLQAMALARDRDAVAREYVTDFEITFEIGLPVLKETLSLGSGFFDGIVQAFLTILSKVPDTLIARKSGEDAACRASQWAGKVLSEGGVLTPRGRTCLAGMDRELRDASHSFNPGTTADLTAAALFLALLEYSPVMV